MNKAGYSVNGEALSTTSHNMYGFDNPTADKIAEDAVMKLVDLVHDLQKGKYGKGK